MTHKRYQAIRMTCLLSGYTADQIDCLDWAMAHAPSLIMEWEGKWILGPFSRIHADIGVPTGRNFTWEEGILVQGKYEKSGGWLGYVGVDYLQTWFDGTSMLEGGIPLPLKKRAPRLASKLREIRKEIAEAKVPK